MRGGSEPAALQNDDDFLEVPVARITLADGYSTITEDETTNIDLERGSERCEMW